MNLTSGKVYNILDTDKFIVELKKEELPLVTKGRGKNQYELYNVPSAFDTETTSVEIDGKKIGYMYIWMFGICGITIYGRTWDEYINFIKRLHTELELSEKRRLVTYVHNLAFDYQFMRKYFSWSSVFASETRKPIYAISEGIEYRCSYLLTLKSLAKLGEELRTYKVKKMVGDLDYKLIRTKDTTITKKELGYCINDVRVLMAFIQETIEQDGGIGKIPYTKTGYVRNYVRSQCFKKRSSYVKLMQYLTLDTDEYIMLKEAFQGGYTHANALYSDEVVTDVTSYDFTSSYPTVMVSEKFPMSKGERIKIKSYKDLIYNIKNYCCLIKIEMVNVKLKKDRADCPISKSKCEVLENPICDNGRIYSASRIVTTITEQDFIIYSKFYDFKFRVIGDIIRYRKAYLPKPIIESIIKFYTDKTTLKDVEGKEGEYLLGKGMLNAIYGMIVMDIVRSEIDYNDLYGWGETPPDIDKQIDDYNTNRNRFTFYPWGVWVTAYARKNLWSGLYECGNDYVYSDTDSMKIINCEKHMDYINKYNECITSKIEKCLDYFHLPLDSCRPKTIEGVEKPLGVWDFDGHFTRFKTLGAKRYMVEKDNGDIFTTIAGVGKKASKSYIISLGGDPFDHFCYNLTIPKENTGKNTHTYIDDEWSGYITDYQGNTTLVETKSGVHLEPTEFSLSLTTLTMEYLGFIMNYKQEYQYY